MTTTRIAASILFLLAVTKASGQTVNYSDLKGARRFNRPKDTWEVGWGKAATTFNGKRSNNLFNYAEPGREILLSQTPQPYIPAPVTRRGSSGREGLDMVSWNLRYPAALAVNERFPNRVAMEVVINCARKTKIQFWLEDGHDFSLTTRTTFEATGGTHTYLLELKKSARFERDRDRAGLAPAPQRIKLVAKAFQEFTLESTSIFHNPLSLYPVRDENPLEGVLFHRKGEVKREGLSGQPFDGFFDLTFDTKALEMPHLGLSADTVVALRCYGRFLHTVFDEKGKAARTFKESWKRGSANSWNTTEFLVDSAQLDTSRDGVWSGHVFGRLRGRCVLDYYVVLPATFFDVRVSGVNTEISFRYKSNKGESNFRARLDPKLYRFDNRTRIAFVNVGSGNGAVYVVQSGNGKARIIGRVADSLYSHKLAVKAGSIRIDPATRKASVRVARGRSHAYAGAESIYLMHGRDLAGGTGGIDSFNVYETARLADVAMFYWAKPTSGKIQLAKILTPKEHWWNLIAGRRPAPGKKTAAVSGEPKSKILSLAAGTFGFLAGAFRPFSKQTHERLSQRSYSEEWDWRTERWNDEPYKTQVLETVAETQRFIDIANAHDLILELALDRYYPDPSLIRYAEFAAAKLDPLTGRTVGVRILDVANPKAVNARLRNLETLLSRLHGVRQTTLITPLLLSRPHMRRYYEYPLYSKAALQSYRKFVGDSTVKWPVEEGFPRGPDTFDKPQRNHWKSYFEWRRKVLTDHIIAVAAVARKVFGKSASYRGMALRLPAAAFGLSVGLDRDRVLACPDICGVVLTESWGTDDPDVADWVRKGKQFSKSVILDVPLYRRRLLGLKPEDIPSREKLRNIFLSKLLGPNVPGGYLRGAELLNPLFSGFGNFAHYGAGGAMWRPELDFAWEMYRTSDYNSRMVINSLVKRIPFKEKSIKRISKRRRPDRYGPEGMDYYDVEAGFERGGTPGQPGTQEWERREMTVPWLAYGQKIVVDGNLSDWGKKRGAGEKFVGTDTCLYTIRRKAGKGGNSCSFRMATDTKNLYIAVEIADNKMPSAGNLRTVAVENVLYSEDLIELFLGFTDPEIDEPVIGYNALHISFNPASLRVGGRVRIGRSRRVTVIPGIEIVVSDPEVTSKYTKVRAELKIPYKRFGFVPKPQAAFAFDIAYADADSFGQWDSYYVWCSRAEPWENTSRWGRMILDERRRTGTGRTHRSRRHRSY